MTRLADFVRGRTMADLYDSYWVPACLDVYAQVTCLSRMQLLMRLYVVKGYGG